VAGATQNGGASNRTVLNLLDAGFAAAQSNGLNADDVLSDGLSSEDSGDDVQGLDAAFGLLDGYDVGPMI
jgi:hypothetical protein